MIREIILDTETTGLNPFQGDKIIEIAAIELIDHISTEKKFHCYLNPERDIPHTSQQIQNITNEMVSMMRTQQAFNGNARIMQTSVDITRRLMQ